MTDVFDKGPSKQEIAAQKAEIAKAEALARKEAELAQQLAEKDEQVKQAEETAKKAAQQLKELEEKERALKAAQEKADAFAAKEAQMAEKEAQLKAMEERIRQKEAEQVRLENEARLQQAKAAETTVQEATVTSEADIESRIAAFESELSMPCPLCGKGEIEEKTTEKGKRFFPAQNQTVGL